MKSVEIEFCSWGNLAPDLLRNLARRYLSFGQQGVSVEHMECPSHLVQPLRSEMVFIAEIILFKLEVLYQVVYDKIGVMRLVEDSDELSDQIDQ